MRKYTNSPLVVYTKLSPNHSGQRTHAIDRITPHCVVGYCTAEGLGGWFARESTQASSNYGIDKDGRVGMYVEEKNRSWCTSSGVNDQRAITIECASDTKEPYSFKDATYKKLIVLCTDICKRYGKKKLIWIDNKTKALAYEPKSDEMLLTVHRWFARNKSCPGNWMFARMGDLAARVTAALGSSPQPQPAPDPELPAVPFLVHVIIDDLNYRSGPGMGYQVNGQTGKGTFTIVDTSDGWGRLKSGAGWIWLKNPEYCTIAGSTTPAPASDPAAAKKSVEELAKEVWEGKWGNGSERKERLTAAGYDYAAVQAAVNAMAKGQTSAQTVTTYKVKSGDSLWSIAAKFLGDGRRYPEIRELNGIKSDNIIYTGQILKIPK